MLKIMIINIKAIEMHHCFDRLVVLQLLIIVFMPYFGATNKRWRLPNKSNLISHEHPRRIKVYQGS